MDNVDRIKQLEDLLIKINSYDPFNRDIWGPCNGHDLDKDCLSCQTFLLDQELKSIICIIKTNTDGKT